VNGVYGQCHRGFYNALTGHVETANQVVVEAPYESIFKLLVTHWSENKHIFLTGFIYT
jgi:hypothetical protein